VISLDSYKRTFDLNDFQIRQIDVRIQSYTEKNLIKYLFLRIWNAVKSIFGQSDWQVAKKILENHIVFVASEASLNTPLHKYINKTNGHSEILLQLLLEKEEFNILEQNLDAWIAEIDTNAEEYRGRLQAKEKIWKWAIGPHRQTFNLVQCGITSLPNIFHLSIFKFLERLHLNFNRLTHLPPEIFQLEYLEILELHSNFLTTIPSEIGRLKRLKVLGLGQNRLTSLPPEIGLLSKLEVLNLGPNPSLTGIPMELLGLSNKCRIDFTGCGLSQAVRNQILQYIEQMNPNPNHLYANEEEGNLSFRARPVYFGPRIAFSMDYADPNRQEKSIEESLTVLFGIVNKDYKTFPNISLIVNEGSLKSWLNRLSFMSDYNAGLDRQRWLANRVLEHLELANTNQEFCNIFAAIIEGAATTCGDRVALSIVHLGIAHELVKIDKNDMPHFADFLTRGVWAMTMLEEIAQNKIPTLQFYDEIEVYLGYPVKLKDRLRLPIDIHDMRFFGCSALSPKDLDDAALFVEGRLQDKQALHQFLISRDDWKAALKNKFPEQFNALEAAKAHEVEQENFQLAETNFKKGLLELTEAVLK
jgi:hypothetical protein